MISNLKYMKNAKRFCTRVSQKILKISTGKLMDKKNHHKQLSLLGHSVRKPEDIEHLCYDSLKKSNEIYLKITSKRNDLVLDPYEIVQLFDDLSNTICSVADWADCIATVHPDRAYRNAANQAHFNLQQLVHKLNMDVDLYSILKKCSATENNQLLDNQANMVISSLLKDFESEGILLSGENKKKFLELKNNCDKICYNYVMGCMEKKNIIYCEKNSLDFSKQLTLLKDMINCRYLMSQYLNYSNYADWTISRCMAGSVSTVEEFLYKIKHKTKSTLQNYFDITGQTFPLNIPYENALEKLFTKKFDHFMFDFAYFLDFVCDFIQSMYHIKFIIDNDCIYNDSWSDNIICIKVENIVHNKILGYIYLDLVECGYTSKIACHFTLFGRKLLSNGEVQLPRVLLSVPIIKQSTACNINDIGIRFESVAEFMHELGHSLHSILYNGKYQHLSGTRCSTDISEIPSTLFENFLNNPTFLYSSQNKYTRDEINLLCKQLKVKKYISYLENNLNATIDLYINNIKQPFNDNNDLIHSIKQCYSSFDDIFQLKNDIIYHQFFQHYANYGAKYYSYLWAEACAGLIYKTNLFKDIFNVDAHSKIQHFLLNQGAIYSGRSIMSNLCNQEDITIDKLVSSLFLNTDF